MDHLVEPRLRERQELQQPTQLQIHHLQAVSIHQVSVQQQIKLEPWEAFLRVVLWTR